MATIKNKDILSKLKDSLKKLETITVDDKNISKLNSEVKELSDAAEQATKVYSMLQEKYNLLCEKQFLIYENLIGAVILNHYVETSYKYINRVKDLIKYIDLFKKDSELLKLIDKLAYYLTLDSPYTDAVDTLKNNICDLLNDTLGNSANKLSFNSEENAIIDTSSSSFKIEKNIKSCYTKFVDSSGYNLKLECSIYGYYDSDGKIGDIFLSCPTLNLNNVRFVKITKQIKLLWLTISRTVYRAVVQDENDEENFYGIELRFKKNWLTGYNCSFDDSVTRVNMKKGLSVEGITYEGGVDTDKKGKVFKELLKDPNDESSGADINKIYNLIKSHRTMQDNSIKEHGSTYEKDKYDEGSQGIRFKYVDEDGDYIKVGNYSSKLTTYISKRWRNIDIKLDTESLNYDDENTLADYADVMFSLLPNIYNTSLRFNSDSSEEIEEINESSQKTKVIKYTFKATFSPENGNETVGNSVPLILNIYSYKYDQLDANGLRKVKIEIVADGESTILIRQNYLYGLLGTLFSPVEQFTPKYKISDPDEILSNPEYGTVYLEGIINKPDTDSESLLSLKNKIVSLFDDVVFKEIYELLTKIGALSMTVSGADGVRKIYDSSYDSSMYDEIKNSIVGVYTKTSSISAVENVSEIIKNNKSDINEISYLISSNYTKIQLLIDELLYSSALVDDIVECYAPNLEREYTYSNLINSMSNTMLIYEGKTDFSEALNISVNMFVTMNVGKYSFDNWYSNISGYIYDNNFLLIKYYLIRILLCELSAFRVDNYDNFNKYILDILIKLIKRNAIDSRYINSDIENAILKESLFEKAYDFKVQNNINAGSISPILISYYPELEFVNKVYIEDDIFTNLENSKIVYIIASKLLQIFLKYKSNNSEEEFLNNLYKFSENNLNIRTCVFILALNVLYEKIKSDYTEISTISNDKIKQILEEYNVIYIHLYKNLKISTVFNNGIIPSNLKLLLGM